MVKSENTKRTESAGRVVFELYWAGLSGQNTTAKATITLGEAGGVEIDMEDVIGEINPHFGW